MSFKFLFIKLSSSAGLGIDFFLHIFQAFQQFNEQIFVSSSDICIQLNAMIMNFRRQVVAHFQKPVVREPNRSVAEKNRSSRTQMVRERNQPTERSTIDLSLYWRHSDPNTCPIRDVEKLVFNRRYPHLLTFTIIIINTIDSECILVSSLFRQHFLFSTLSSMNSSVTFVVLKAFPVRQGCQLSAISTRLDVISGADL